MTLRNQSLTVVTFLLHDTVECLKVLIKLNLRSWCGIQCFQDGEFQGKSGIHLVTDINNAVLYLRWCLWVVPALVQNFRLLLNCMLFGVNHFLFDSLISFMVGQSGPKR